MKEGKAIHLLTVMWGLFFSYWGLSALKTKSNVRAESVAVRLIVEVTLFTLALILELASDLRMGPLGSRFLPASSGVVATGALITAGGMAFAIWARHHLGAYWSGRISVKQDHHLIRTGPYRFVRHPIYSGISVGMVGSAIAVGEVRGLVATLLVLVVYAYKIQREEEWLLTAFGTEYAAYQKETKALVPFIW